ncbi:MAG: hypothetical protein GY833_21550 [Aestuariibacter sp.]|nr:hypothetical protein [Aestuariibacter sp.]
MARSEITHKIGERVRAQYEQKIVPDVRQALLDEVSCYPSGDVAVLLSSGIDSHAVLFACIEAGLQPAAYSFALEGHQSTDVKIAENTCEVLGVPFTRVDLPTSKEHLYRYLNYAIGKLGLTGKADIECCWPMTHAFGEITQSVVLTGIGADDYFATTKKGCMHLREHLDRYRAHTWRQEKSQRRVFKSETMALGKFYHSPYDSTRFWAEVHDATDWDTVNKPEKALLREAFPELFSQCNVRRHTDLQLGDSGIAQHFADTLLNSDLNTKGFKSVVGIYNGLVSGELTL